MMGNNKDFEAFKRMQAARSFQEAREQAERDKTERDIRAAEMHARGMAPVRTDADEERRKNEAVREFFGEEGLPKDLQQGWAIYEQRREQRLKVGAPLPPGGCLVLGREAAMAGAMAEAHMKLSAALRLHSNAIRLRLKRDEAGRINLVAAVDPPDDWIIPITLGDQPAQDPKEAAKVYIQSVLKQINIWFREVASERLAACDLVRVNLLQPVAPMAKGNGSQG